MTDRLQTDPSPNPLDRLLGLQLTRVESDRVEAEMVIRDEHKQAHGIVHGGVYCTIAEAIASIGANMRVGEEHVVVGISNKTNFIRAVRSGTLSAHAVPVSEESGQQTWESSIVDERQRLVATALVTLLRLDSVPGQHALAEKPSAQGTGSS